MSTIYALKTYLVSFFVKLADDTKSVTAQFRTIRDKDETNDSEINAARTKYYYELIKIWTPRVYLPLMGIIFVGYFIKTFFIELLVLGYAIYYLSSRATKDEPRQADYSQYLYVRDFIFGPMRELSAQVSAKMPQNADDIHFVPEFNSMNGFETFLYKLKKITYEPITDDDLDFAKKTLSASIVDALDKYERIERNQSTICGDLRRIHLLELRDMGDHYLIEIAFVDNPLIYQYVVNHILSEFKSDGASVRDPIDQDF